MLPACCSSCTTAGRGQWPLDTALGQQPGRVLPTGSRLGRGGAAGAQEGPSPAHGPAKRGCFTHRAHRCFSCHTLVFVPSGHQPLRLLQVPMKGMKSPGDRVSLACSSPAPANVPVCSGANAAEKPENRGHYAKMSKARGYYSQPVMKIIYRQVVMELISSVCIRYSPVNEQQRTANRDGGNSDREQPGYSASAGYNHPPTWRWNHQSM